jgi:hypothetical protein
MDFIGFLSLAKMCKEGSKKCSKCKELKQLILFGKEKRSKSGIATVCKLCKNKTSKLNKGKRKPIERFKEGNKKCKTCNTEKHVDSFPTNKWCSMGVHSMCRDCNVKKANKWVRDNRKKSRATYKKQYYKDHEKTKELERNRKLIQRQKTYNDPEKLEHRKKVTRDWKQKNKERINKDARNKRKIDPLHKIKTNLRCNIKDAFVNTLNGEFQKSMRTSEILGCTYEEFMDHIKSQFVSWMKWENYGNCKSNEYDCSWHLDHIIPVTYAKNREQLLLLNHWSNFQPLCSRKNVVDKNGNVLPVTNLELNITVGI